MKCTGISVGNTHPRDSRTLEQFAVSEQATTPLGKLLIALTGESAWSSEYTIYASFGHEPFLQVNHKTFLPERSLMIYGNGKTVLSVRGAEDAVRAHLRDSENSVRPTLHILQSRMNDLRRVSERITIDKAKAAIVAVFPEAEAAMNYYGPQGDLYHFAVDASKGPSFVTREIDNEFVRGVARVDYNNFGWYRAGDGIEKNQRHGIFWAALARAFAARELQIPEGDLYCEKVFASEKPLEFPRPAGYDPYIVEKVVFSGRGRSIVVEFGSDNLPAKALVQKESELPF